MQAFASGWVFLRPALVCEPALAQERLVRAALPRELQAAAEALLSLLDGGRTADELVAHAICDLEVEDILGALEALDRAGLLCEAPGSDLAALTEADRDRFAPHLRELAWLAGADGSPGLARWPAAGVQALARLRRASVLAVGRGKGAEQVLTLLAHSGVGRVETCDMPAPASEEGAMPCPPPALPEGVWSLLLHMPDCFDPTQCGSLNLLALRSGTPLLVVRERWLETLVGPLVVPGETACWECAERRRLGALTEAEREAVVGVPEAPALGLGLGNGLAALDALRFLSGAGEPITLGRVWRLDAANGSAAAHAVLKLPRCPACGVRRDRPLRRLWEE